MLDMREYDVPYIQRVCTDRGLRVGLWYTVIPLSDNSVKLTQIADKHDRPILHIMVSSHCLPKSARLFISKGSFVSLGVGY